MLSDFEKLIDFKNLYASMTVSLKGCRNRGSAMSFARCAMENLIYMKRELVDRTYSISPYKSFEITDPKRRVIMCGSFRDKVLQHCLCDYVLMPRLRSVFIEDNYAGQIGKGTLFGLDRLSCHLVEHYSEYGTNGYILKCDISKFYYSIRHDIMKRVVADYFQDDGIRWICNLLIDSTEGEGLPLGNQCSQVFALMYLVSLDNLVTGRLGFAHYGRYADDFFVISDNRDELKRALVEISSHLSAIGLRLNGKTEIVPIRKGIRFLGFHIYLTTDGRVIRRVCGSKRRAELKKLRRCAKLVLEGGMSERKFNEIYASIRNHLSHGNCDDLLQRYEAIVSSILSNKNGGAFK